MTNILIISASLAAFFGAIVAAFKKGQSYEAAKQEALHADESRRIRIKFNLLKRGRLHDRYRD